MHVTHNSHSWLLFIELNKPQFSVLQFEEWLNSLKKKKTYFAKLRPEKNISLHLIYTNFIKVPTVMETSAHKIT